MPSNEVEHAPELTVVDPVVTSYRLEVVKRPDGVEIVRLWNVDREDQALCASLMPRGFKTSDIEREMNARMKIEMAKFGFQSYTEKQLRYVFVHSIKSLEERGRKWW